MSTLPRRYCGPFVDRDGDVQRALVGRQFQHRRPDLDLHVAAIPVVRLQQDEVALKDVLAIGPGLGHQRQDVALARDDHIAQLLVGNRLVADEVDAADLHLGVLVAPEPDLDLGRTRALQLVVHLGHVEALLDVELLDLLDVLLQFGEVQHLFFFRSRTSLILVRLTSSFPAT